MQTHKLPSFERQRRWMAITITVGVGLLVAALVGAAIYLLYHSSRVI